MRLKNKKILTMAILALIFSIPPSRTHGSMNNEMSNDYGGLPKFHYFTGTIGHTSVIDLLFSGKSKISISVTDNNGENFIFHTGSKTIVADQRTMELVSYKNLAEGQTVYTAYSSTTPIAISYPPQSTPDVVVIMDSTSPVMVKVDKFDKYGLSSDGKLKINMSPQTIVVDTKGKAVDSQTLANKDLLVFYTIETYNLQSQTTPVKIIVLPYKSEMKI